MAQRRLTDSDYSASAMTGNWTDRTETIAAHPRNNDSLPEGAADEQFSYPIALDGIRDALAAAALKVRAHTKRKKRFDNLPLRPDGGWTARPSTPGVLHRKVKRS